MPGAVDFFRPDFENANLSEEFYRRVHEQFVLIGTEYMLSGVPLECVNLDFANLKGAGLHAANLTRAYLRDADLTEADLSRANLRGAVLWRANLAKADLHWADLAGANLAGAELWKAILHYPDDLSPDQLPRFLIDTKDCGTRGRWASMLLKVTSPRLLANNAPTASLQATLSLDVNVARAYHRRRRVNSKW